jgi:ABC-2 type transport system ATP-binding protein
MSAIQVRNLHRKFKSERGGFFRRSKHEIEALRGIDLDVPAGSLFGLLGPNGAGKTTTVKILTTLLVPTSGTVLVHGVDIIARPMDVRSQIGYAFGGDKGFYDRLSAYDNLLFFADLYQLPLRRQRRRVEELLELVDLKERQGDRVETYSRGMKQRLHIARSLLIDPKIIYLDEPTNGLDPVAARHIRASVSRLRDAGKTILLTTHYMFEAEELCDRLAVINHGKIAIEGTVRDLAAATKSGTVARVETRGATDSLREALLARPDIVDASIETLSDRELLTVRTSMPNSEHAEKVVREVINEAGYLDVLHFSLRDPTLEDAYVALVSDRSDDGQNDR